MKNPDVLDELSGSEFEEHDEYDWFHTQEQLSSSTQGKYGGIINNDYGYDNRAVIPSLAMGKKGLGFKSVLGIGRIVEESEEAGGIIEIDWIVGIEIVILGLIICLLSLILVKRCL